MSKVKCKCGHGEDVHLPIGEPTTECCVQYRGKDGLIKCCPCMEFEEKN